MKISTFFIFSLLIAFGSCKNHRFTIQETKRLEGKSEKQYIEGSITSGTNSIDTILYYKFDLLTDSATLKESSKLNIGINYSRIREGSSYSVNLGFKSIPRGLKSDTLKILDSGNGKNFTNFSNEKLYKGTETSVGFSNDRYFAPSTPTFLTSEKKMKEFLRLFETDISEALNNNDKVIYSSICHLDGYFQSISMIVTFK